MTVKMSNGFPWDLHRCHENFKKFHSAARVVTWLILSTSVFSEGKKKISLYHHLKLPEQSWARIDNSFNQLFVIMLENCTVNCSNIRLLTPDEELCMRFTTFKNENVPRLVIVFNSTINIILAIVSVLANSLIISAVWRTPSLRYPSMVFLCGLAVSDLAVGLFVQPLFIAVELLKIHGHPSGGNCTLEIVFVTLAFVVCGVSFGNITLISLDRHLAIEYPLRYNSIVTLPRVVFGIALCWITSLFCSSLVLWNLSAFHFVVATIIIVFLGTSTVVYIKIYRIVRRHKSEIRAQEQAVHTTNKFNMARLKTSAMNTFVVYCFLLLCYVPFSIAWILQIAAGNRIKHPIASKLANTILYLNSALNPFLYCWRLPAMRRPVVLSLNKIFGLRKIASLRGQQTAMQLQITWPFENGW